MVKKVDMRPIAFLAVEELYIVPMCDDGKSFGKPVQLWFVVLNNTIYIRAYKGAETEWYRAALKHKRGQLIIDDHVTDVSFEVEDGPINSLIDETFINKYAGRYYLDRIIYEPGRSSTLRLRPIALVEA